MPQDQEIPLITQEYIDAHPDRPGLVIGQPLPDAPQVFVRELIVNKEEIETGKEPVITNLPTPQLNDLGDDEKILKQRSDREGVLVYTIRKPGIADQILQVAAGSELAFQLDERINRQQSNTPEAKSDLENAENGDTYKVYDENGTFLRAYNSVDHGEDAAKLAQQYADSVNGSVK